MSSSITNKHISEAKVASTSLEKHRLIICMLEKAGAHPRRWRITMRNPWCWCMKKAIAFQCYNLVRRRSMMYFVKKSGDMSLRIESWGWRTEPKYFDVAKPCGAPIISEVPHLLTAVSDHQRPSQTRQFPATLEDHRDRPVDSVLTLHKLSSWFVPTMHQQKVFSPAS